MAQRTSLGYEASFDDPGGGKRTVVRETHISSGLERIAGVALLVLCWRKQACKIEVTGREAARCASPRIRHMLQCCNLWLIRESKKEQKKEMDLDRGSLFSRDGPDVQRRKPWPAEHGCVGDNPQESWPPNHGVHDFSSLQRLSLPWSAPVFLLNSHWMLVAAEVCVREGEDRASAANSAVCCSPRGSFPTFAGAGGQGLCSCFGVDWPPRPNWQGRMAWMEGARVRRLC